MKIKKKVQIFWNIHVGLIDTFSIDLYNEKSCTLKVKITLYSKSKQIFFMNTLLIYLYYIAFRGC